MQGIGIRNIDKNRNLFVVGFSKSFFNKQRPITRTDIDKTILTLFTDYNANTFTIKKGIGRDFLIGEIPKSLVEEVEKITGFLPVDIYPEDCKPLHNEIGCVGNMRFIVVGKENNEEE